MAAFIFKVFTLTIRTVSKPLAARVQNYVLQHPKLRKPVIELAQVRLVPHLGIEIVMAVVSVNPGRLQ